MTRPTADTLRQFEDDCVRLFQDYEGDDIEAAMIESAKERGLPVNDDVRHIVRMAATGGRRAMTAPPAARPEPPPHNGHQLEPGLPPEPPPHNEVPSQAEGEPEHQAEGARHGAGEREERRRRQPDPNAPPLDFVDASTFDGKPVPDQQWLSHERIPMAVPTLLAGDGGTGKTRIAMQLAAATVLGTDWLGSTIDRTGPVLFYTAEEDEAHCHRMLDRIATHLQISLARLKGLLIRPMDAADPVLAEPDRRGLVSPTPTYDRLWTAAGKIRPALIVLDTAADIFAVDENNRTQARQCVALLRHLAHQSGGGAVLTLAHPSVYGMTSGRGTSGSTGWSNSVRSRLYFVKTSGEDDEATDNNVRELRVMKSNYGPEGAAVRVVWREGVFVPVGSAAPLAQVAAEADADAAYLDCLDAANAQNRRVFPETGRGFAPKIFEGMPQARGLRARALHRAQERLMAAGRLHVVESGPPSKRVRQLARKSFAEAAE